MYFLCHIFLVIICVCVHIVQISDGHPVSTSPDTGIGVSWAVSVASVAIFAIAFVMSACCFHWCRDWWRKKYGEFENFSNSDAEGAASIDTSEGIVNPVHREVPVVAAPQLAIHINNNLQEDNNNGPISPHELENIENNNAATYIVSENEDRNSLSPEIRAREATVRPVIRHVDERDPPAVVTVQIETPPITNPRNQLRPVPTARQPQTPNRAIAGTSNGVTHNCDILERDWFSSPLDDFPRNNLKYLREIGNGWFGSIVEAEARLPCAKDPSKVSSRVAVKILSKNVTLEEKRTFLSEGRLCRDIKHSNILSLIGKNLSEEPWLMIYEFCPMGDLKQYLLANRTKMASLNENVVPLRLQNEVAGALAFIHSNGLVHTDVACHTVLLVLDPASGAVKSRLGDYGDSLNRHPDDYCSNGGLTLPIRWCAPEALKSTTTDIIPNKLEPSADVWSLGVFLWEVSSWGQLPYGDLENDAVITALSAACQTGIFQYLLPEPSLPCPYRGHLYQIMQICWNVDPNKRPTASQVQDLLSHLLKHHSEMISPQSHWQGTSLNDFESRWESLKPNVIDEHVENQSHGRTLLENSLIHNNVEVNSSNNLNHILASPRNVERKSPRKDQNWFRRQKQVDESIEMEQHKDLESTIEMVPWLKGVPITCQEDISYMETVSNVITDLDNILSSEKTSSSESSHQASPLRDGTPTTVKRDINKQASENILISESSCNSITPSHSQSKKESNLNNNIKDEVKCEEMVNPPLDFRLGYDSLTSPVSSSSSRPIYDSDEKQSDYSNLFDLKSSYTPSILASAQFGYDDKSGFCDTQRVYYSSGSETEDETWKMRVEMGVLTEKVKMKSKSVTDLMVLTHIDTLDLESDSTPLNSLDFRINAFELAYTTSKDEQSTGQMQEKLFRRNFSLVPEWRGSESLRPEIDVLKVRRNAYNCRLKSLRPVVSMNNLSQLSKHSTSHDLHEFKHKMDNYFRCANLKNKLLPNKALNTPLDVNNCANNESHLTNGKSFVKNLELLSSCDNAKTSAVGNTCLIEDTDTNNLLPEPSDIVNDVVLCSESHDDKTVQSVIPHTAQANEVSSKNSQKCEPVTESNCLENMLNTPLNVKIGCDTNLDNVPNGKDYELENSIRLENNTEHMQSSNSTLVPDESNQDVDGIITADNKLLNFELGENDILETNNSYINKVKGKGKNLIEETSGTDLEERIHHFSHENHRDLDNNCWLQDVPRTPLNFQLGEVHDPEITQLQLKKVNDMELQNSHVDNTCEYVLSEENGSFHFEIQPIKEHVSLENVSKTRELEELQSLELGEIVPFRDNCSNDIGDRPSSSQSKDDSSGDSYTLADESIPGNGISIEMPNKGIAVCKKLDTPDFTLQIMDDVSELEHRKECNIASHDDQLPFGSAKCKEKTHISLSSSQIHLDFSPCESSLNSTSYLELPGSPSEVSEFRKSEILLISKSNHANVSNGHDILQYDKSPEQNAKLNKEFLFSGAHSSFEGSDSFNSTSYFEVPDMVTNNNIPKPENNIDEKMGSKHSSFNLIKLEQTAVSDSVLRQKQHLQKDTFAPAQPDSSVAIGPFEECTLELYSGLKTNTDRFNPEFISEDEALAFSSNFTPLNNEIRQQSLIKMQETLSPMDALKSNTLYYQPLAQSSPLTYDDLAYDKLDLIQQQFTAKLAIAENENNMNIEHSSPAFVDKAATKNTTPHEDKEQSDRSTNCSPNSLSENSYREGFGLDEECVKILRNELEMKLPLAQAYNEHVMGELSDDSDSEMIQRDPFETDNAHTGNCFVNDVEGDGATLEQPISDHPDETENASNVKLNEVLIEYANYSTTLSPIVEETFSDISEYNQKLVIEQQRQEPSTSSGIRHIQSSKVSEVSKKFSEKSQNPGKSTTIDSWCSNDTLFNVEDNFDDFIPSPNRETPIADCQMESRTPLLSTADEGDSESTYLIGERFLDSQHHTEIAKLDYQQDDKGDSDTFALGENLEKTDKCTDANKTYIIDSKDGICESGISSDMTQGLSLLETDSHRCMPEKMRKTAFVHSLTLEKLDFSLNCSDVFIDSQFEFLDKDECAKLVKPDDLKDSFLPNQSEESKLNQIRDKQMQGNEVADIGSYKDFQGFASTMEQDLMSTLQSSYNQFEISALTKEQETNRALYGHRENSNTESNCSSVNLLGTDILSGVSLGYIEFADSADNRLQNTPNVIFEDEVKPATANDAGSKMFPVSCHKCEEGATLLNSKGSGTLESGSSPSFDKTTFDSHEHMLSSTPSPVPRNTSQAIDASFLDASFLNGSFIEPQEETRFETDSDSLENGISVGDKIYNSSDVNKLGIENIIDFESFYGSSGQSPSMLNCAYIDSSNIGSDVTDRSPESKAINDICGSLQTDSEVSLPSTAQYKENVQEIILQSDDCHVSIPPSCSTKLNNQNILEVENAASEIREPKIFTGDDTIGAAVPASEELQSGEFSLKDSTTASSQFYSASSDTFLQRERGSCESSGQYFSCYTNDSYPGMSQATEECHRNSGDDLMSTSFNQESPIIEEVKFPQGSPSRNDVPPENDGREWESETDDSHSNSSEDFVWKDGSCNDCVITAATAGDVSDAEHGHFAINKDGTMMQIVEECSDDDDFDEGEENDFTPSSWNCNAIPSKSAMKSPETSHSENKKHVAFKEEKYQNIYEYPREVHTPDDELDTCLADSLPDYSTYSDWKERNDIGDVIGNEHLVNPIAIDYQYTIPLSSLVNMSFMSSLPITDGYFVSDRSFGGFDSTSQFFPGHSIEGVQEYQPEASNILESNEEDQRAVDAKIEDSESASGVQGFITPDSGMEDMSSGSPLAYVVNTDNKNMHKADSLNLDFENEKSESQTELKEREVELVESGISSRPKRFKGGLTLPDQASSGGFRTPNSPSPHSLSGSGSDSPLSPQTLGGLRHTRDKLKLNLPPSPLNKNSPTALGGDVGNATK